MLPDNSGETNEMELETANEHNDPTEPLPEVVDRDSNNNQIRFSLAANFPPAEPNPDVEGFLQENKFLLYFLFYTIACLILIIVIYYYRKKLKM